MKNLLLFVPFLAIFFAFSGAPDTDSAGCAPCTSKYDALEYSDIPSFKQDDWYESYDPWYGTHYTSMIRFSDGYSGKIFKGGSSGKFFIGGASGGKFYYQDQRATIRALYIYKKYDCISNRYQN